MEQRIEAPSHSDNERIARQILRAEAIVEAKPSPNAAKYGEPHLDLIQGAINRRLVDLQNTFDLQCLGLLFGCAVLERVSGMDWWMVEDECGRDPALRYENTDLLVYPMTMISKRVENGETVNVRELFNSLCEQLEDIKREHYDAH